jgi:hypothetical protein
LTVIIVVSADHLSELGLRPDNPTVHSALQEKKLTFLDVVN